MVTRQMTLAFASNILPSLNTSISICENPCYHTALTDPRTAMTRVGECIRWELLHDDRSIRPLRADQAQRHAIAPLAHTQIPCLDVRLGQPEWMKDPMATI